MDTNKNAIITGLDIYLKELQYLAHENKKSLNNIFNLCMLDFLYEWSFSIETPIKIQQRLLKFMDLIIANDDILTKMAKHLERTGGKWKEIFQTNNVYKSTNIPHSFASNERIYDNPNYKLINLKIK